MLQCLLLELGMQKQFLKNEEIQTIYFGGGTPSLLNPEEINLLIDKIKEDRDVQISAEITLEANPDDLDPARIEAFARTGINRLSIGIQSFYEEDLRFMNRSHSAAQAERCLEYASDSLLQTYSADLIFGFQGLDMNKWRSNIDRMLGYGVPHISCYGMTVEPKTALQRFIQNKSVLPPDDEVAATQYLYLIDRLEDAGYHHYEISNFAKPGHEAKHNSNYWKQRPYLGIGPSAHSFDGRGRQWNIANNAVYIRSVQKGKLPFERETLTRSQMINEEIMISLRTSGGIQLHALKQKLNNTEWLEFMNTSDSYVQQGLLEVKSEQLILSRQGKLFADGIASDLFVG